MAKLFVLVGVPGSGKSTWASNQEWAKDCAYISTDKFVEAYAREVNLTYSEVFKEFMPTAVKLMADEVIKARAKGSDIIWDQTSTSIGSRKKKFNMLPDYYKIAVVFPIPDTIELARRLGSRPGKHIPANVLEEMIKSFEMPTKEEGFDEIWTAV